MKRPDQLWPDGTSDEGVTHACPNGPGIPVMPCCSRTPFEVPLTDRMTLDPSAVTCTGSGTSDDD